MSMLYLTWFLWTHTICPTMQSYHFQSCNPGTLLSPSGLRKYTSMRGTLCTLKPSNGSHTNWSTSKRRPMQEPRLSADLALRHCHVCSYFKANIYPRQEPSLFTFPVWTMTHLLPHSASQCNSHVPSSLRCILSSADLSGLYLKSSSARSSFGCVTTGLAHL